MFGDLSGHSDHHLEEGPEDEEPAVGHPDVWGLRHGHQDEAVEDGEQEEDWLAEQRPIQVDVTKGKRQRSSLKSSLKCGGLYFVHMIWLNINASGLV